MRFTGCIAVIFGERAVGNHKNLHVLKETTSRPERLPLIAVDLIERLFDVHTTPLQFDMHKGKTVDQDGNVIPVVMHSGIGGILIDDLQLVVVDVFLVDQPDVFDGAVIPGDNLDVVLLDRTGFFRNPLIRIGNHFFEEVIPFGIRKGQFVQFFQFPAQIGNQVGFRVDGQILIRLHFQQINKSRFQCGFRLIEFRPSGFRGNIGGNNGAFRILGDDVKF